MSSTTIDANRPTADLDVAIRETTFIPSVRAIADTWVYGGLAMAAAGFAVILLAWGRAAGETAAAEQIPWIIVAAAGLGLIVVGMTGVLVVSRRSECAAMLRQSSRTLDVLNRVEEQR